MGTALNTWHEIAPPAVAPLDRYGLFSVAQMRTDALENGRADGHWRFGIEFYDNYTDYYTGFVEGGPCPEPGSLYPYGSGQCAIRQFDPLTQYSYSAENVPGWTLEQRRQLVIDRLVSDEERELEYWLWTQWATAVPVPNDFSFYHGWVGLGAAEEYMGWDTTAGFVLHMDRATAISLSLHLHVEGGVLKTITGTPVVVGSGYANSFYGQYPYSVITATGPLVLYRGEIDVTPTNVLNMATNEVSYIAQRDYAAGWLGYVRRFKIALDTPQPW